MKNIAQKLKYTLAAIALMLGLSSVLFAPDVSAALFDGAKSEACAGTQLNRGSGPGCTSTASDNLSETLKKGINLLTIVVGIMAVIMLIIGGMRFVLSNGDSNKVTSARNTIIYALIGLILVAFAQVIVKFVLDRV